MALKNGKPNPLNALDLRKVSFPAYHFYFVTLKHSGQYYTIDDWIYNNLNGRYYISNDISLIDNQFQFVTRIGFEQEKELSFFKLACPYFH